MILLVDNYDSFVHNLARYFRELGRETAVHRNDALSCAEIEAMAPSHIVLSPGPCTPDQAGISVELVRHLGSRVPILGVCLGHQSIGAAFGGAIRRAEPVHGKAALVSHDGGDLFRGLDNPFPAGRYHSLVVEQDDLPDELQVTARTGDDIVMGLRHRSHSTFGVQFHPESILTPGGKELLKNFLELCGEV